ncbi:hypothetical protein LXL04_008311 [Taraxacum kok-saghyz]
MCGLNKMFSEMSIRDLVSWNSIVDGYVEVNDTEAALKLFDKMLERNVVFWNAMMKTYLDAQSIFAPCISFSHTQTYFYDFTSLIWDMFIESMTTSMNGYSNTEMKFVCAFEDYRDAEDAIHGRDYYNFDERCLQVDLAHRG